MILDWIIHKLVYKSFQINSFNSVNNVNNFIQNIFEIPKHFWHPKKTFETFEPWYP